MHTYYPIGWPQWQDIYFTDGSAYGEELEKAETLHLWNEAQRGSSFDRTATWAHDSLFEQLWRRYMRD